MIFRPPFGGSRIGDRTTPKRYWFAGGIEVQRDGPLLAHGVPEKCIVSRVVPGSGSPGNLPLGDSGWPTTPAIHLARARPRRIFSRASMPFRARSMKSKERTSARRRSGAAKRKKKRAGERRPSEFAKRKRRLHYLAEFAKELNGVLPTTERPYGFIHLRQASPMVLSSAFADYRLRKVDGDEVCDQVFLTYHARYAQPAAMDVAGPDIEYCRRFFALSQVPFEFSALKKNDFGQALSGTFSLSSAIPCEVHIRADYDAPAVLIELLNVGSIGTGRCRLAEA